MTLSYSSINTFKKCQRKWYYSNIVKANNTKDEFRKEIGILSNIQTIDAWRGEIVDYTISNFVIRKINQEGELCSLEDTLNFAKKLCRKRYDFAKKRNYRDDGVIKYKEIEQYAALYNFEFDSNTLNKDFTRAWSDIEIALTNLYNNEEVIDLFEDPENTFIAQRTLHLEVDGYKLKGIPDLIIFNEFAPPKIIDWKVHFEGNKTFNKQLLIYALALSKSEHRDFPKYIRQFGILEYDLIEYQLLINEYRSYPVDKDYINEIEAFLIDSSYQLEHVHQNKKYKELSIENFECTNNPQYCINCPFHKICDNET